MTTFVSIKPQETKKENLSLRIPFVLPSCGADKTVSYVVTIKEEAPFDFYSLGGVDFAKRTLPTEASLAGNEGKRYSYRYMTFNFTKKQKDAILEEAKKRILTLPSVPINGKGAAKYKSGKVVVGDYLVLKPKDTFNPIETFHDTPEPQDMGSVVSDTIYVSQSKKKG